MTTRQTIGDLRASLEQMPPGAAALILLDLIADCFIRLPVRARQAACEEFTREIIKTVSERMSGRAA